MDEIVQTLLGRPKDLAKRQRILESAKALFLMQGYHGSSMNQIAENAGVSKITVYNHFQDKANLFTCSIEHTCETFLLTHAVILTASSDFSAALKQLCLMCLNLVSLPEAIKLEHLMVSLAAEQNPLAQQFYAASHGKMRHMWQHFFQQAIALQFIHPTFHVTELEECIGSLLLGTRHHDVLLGIRETPTPEQQQQIAEHAVHIFSQYYLSHNQRTSS